jgi:HEAT repeat protein
MGAALRTFKAQQQGPWPLSSSAAVQKLKEALKSPDKEIQQRAKFALNQIEGDP